MLSVVGDDGREGALTSSGGSGGDGGRGEGRLGEADPVCTITDADSAAAAEASRPRESTSAGTRYREANEGPGVL